MGATRSRAAMRAGILTAVVAAACVGVGATARAGAGPDARTASCRGNPWTTKAAQQGATPLQLAEQVLACMKAAFPATYRHDEVGLVALNSYPWFQNVNEFGLTSTVQQDMAKLGMPPITLQDGPEGLITRTHPSPTRLPNELALGATFDPSLAALYGNVLGSQAKVMGYDAVQAPDLNLVRTATWGRASESFGESPVLAGELGGVEALAMERWGIIPVLKHFGPYSQDTDRRLLDQKVNDKTFNELYVRPFTLALRTIAPILKAGGHAVGIMCSYGNVNQQKACRSDALAVELNTIGIQALVRSDLDVKVNPTALLLNGIDLVKPMDSGQLVAALGNPAIDSALDLAVTNIFETEFAGGLVNGRTVAARPHPLSHVQAYVGTQDAISIEQRAVVLLKNQGLLPLSAGAGRIAVIGDRTLPNTCHALAQTLGIALSVPSTCTNDGLGALPSTVLFHGLHVSHSLTQRTTTYTAPVRGPYVLTVATLGNTRLLVDGAQVMSTQGLAEFQVQRTSMVTLNAGTTHAITVQWRGAPPHVTITREQAAVNAAVNGVAGARVAIVLAYDLAREGMDRNSLDLPGVQNAVIAAVASRVPTIVLLATDGAVTMPWLSSVRAVMEVWDPTGMDAPDVVLAPYTAAWRNLLTGVADPSGRLPVTFPVYGALSPLADQSFWPGYNSVVDLNQPPNHGLGIGLPWYRATGWPVAFPFGFGLSYTTFQLLGGSVTNGPGGLQMTVAVRDTGALGGTMPVEVYANFPSALGEPARELVGFGVVGFTRAEAHGTTVKRVTIALAADALSTWTGTSMHVQRGAYCLAASAYNGDPHSVSTGSVTLTATSAGAAAIVGSAGLSAGNCPG